MTKRKTIIFIILIILSAVSIFISAFLLLKKENEEQFALKTYRNTVALYCGDELIKTYDDIVLNTLPKEDIKCFSNGIYIDTIEEADEYLTDYE